jgi:hypothetical protein
LAVNTSEMSAREQPWDKRNGRRDQKECYERRNLKVSWDARCRIWEWVMASVWAPAVILAPRVTSSDVIKPEAKFPATTFTKPKAGCTEHADNVSARLLLFFVIIQVKNTQTRLFDVRSLPVSLYLHAPPRSGCGVVPFHA